MDLKTGRARRYSAIAKELTAAASTVTLPESRSSLLNLAAAYNRMAAVVGSQETTEPPPPKMDRDSICA
jgi:hypothetical protein